VFDGDRIGDITWYASDGTDFANNCAAIMVNIDGTPGANDTPGRLTFHTAADGSGGSSERMRIDSSGNVGIGTTSPTGKLSIAGASGVGANVYLDNHTADADSSNLIFRKSRNATIGSHGAVTNNDVIGQIYFQGSDGNSSETGALIQAKAPADWGSDETVSNELPSEP
jgi:hypothetical protein